MAVLPTNLDFTDRDFDSLRARLEALLRSVFPDWTDFQVANFGVLMMEMYAFVGGILNFYQDNQAGESRIVTATQRKNLIALSKLIGFSPSGNFAATAELTVTLSEPPVGDFTLAIGQEVRTKQVTSPVKFQLLAVASIPAASDPPTTTVDVENSVVQAESFTSSSLPNQEFELGEIPFIDSSLAVVAADGAYTEVENFLSSTATDRHFVVVVDQNDRATIKFGNAVNGTIPQGTIDVDYKTGGGSIGNVEAGNIEVIDGAFTDDLGNPVQITITNAVKASGGVDRDTVEQIRQEAPEELRVLNRTVAREDYEINAKRLPQVARALMTTSNEDPGVDENAGKLYVIPVGGGTPTQTLKDAVEEQVTVTFPNTLTFVVEVVDPIYLTINVSARVYRATGFSQTDTRDAIQDALDAFFALDNADGSENTDIDFGFNFKDVDGNPSGEIAWSTILAIVENTDAVRKVGDQVNDFSLNGVDDDVAITVREFPILGTLTLIDGDTGLAF
jgi:hypothetical protein